MSKIIAAFATLMLLATQAVGAINPSNLNSVTFVNKTGYDIRYLFCSPDDSGQWGPDILGTTRSLNNGQSAKFFIHYPDNCNEFDFMAVDTDNDAYVVMNYNICDGTPETIVLTLDHYKPEIDVDLNMTRLTLRNTTSYTMNYVFVSPSDSRMWGIDMLGGSDTLTGGESMSLFVPVNTKMFKYDFHSVDTDGDGYQFSFNLTGGGGEQTFDIEMSDLQN